LIDAATHNELLTALQWYVDHGVTDVLLNDAIDRTIVIEPAILPSVISSHVMDAAQKAKVAMDAHIFLGKSDAYDEAVRLAKSVDTLGDLQKIIAKFDGVALKKTATNMVFAGGNSNAKIMLIGDAPMAEDDRLGQVFSGVEGQLLDKMLGCIGLGRNYKDMDRAVYMSNMLNWRPPGNRSPSLAEIEVSLPFIEKHIQLAKPKILIFCGSATAKALLGRSESISRLRKSWHDYMPQTSELCTKDSVSIPAIVIHSMPALIKTPSQKKAAWADMLMLQEKL